MSTFSAVTSNAALALNDVVALYTCPAGKTHAYVDVNIFKPDSVSGDASFAIAVTSNAIGAIVDTDYLLGKPILVTSSARNYFANKIAVGTGQTLYVKCLSGSFNARLSGIEENNPAVLAAGKLAGIAVPTTGLTSVFKTALSAATVSMVSVSIRNAAASTPATIAAYITNAVSPGPADRIDDLVLQPGQYSLYANIILKPNESFFIDNTAASVFAVVNGVTQG